MLQAGIELVGVPGPDGTAEALTRAVRGARRRRARRATGSGSATPRCTRALLDAHGVPARRAAAILHELVTRDFVGLEREVDALRLGAEATSRCCGVPQLRGGPEVLDAAPARRPTACAPCYDRLPRRGRRARDLRPRARRARSATTRARCSRSTTPRSARRSAAAGATTTCSAASAATCPPCGWALNVERLHIALRGRARAGSGLRAGLNGLTLAVPRGALFGETLDLLDALGVDTAEVRANDRKLLFEDAGIVTMRPVRRADLRRGGRRRHRHHRQGRARRAVRARRSTSCSTSASGRA